MSAEWIVVAGAREHNLKGVTVRIPRNRLTVITGLSGSGKSSLAFDTLYAEGQRRYVESLSAYARQFLEQMQKPDADFIEGLPPAISIEQRTAGANPRSIVATTTEIYDYLRLLYAAIGRPHCPKCGRPIARQSAEEITAQLLALPEGTRVTLLAPVVAGRVRLQASQAVPASSSTATMPPIQRLRRDRGRRGAAGCVSIRVLLLLCGGGCPWGPCATRACQRIRL